MGNIDVVRVELVRERQLESERFQVADAKDAAFLFRRYLAGADREHFVVAMLDTKHVVNAIHTVSIGSLDATVVHPREVFKAAILASASAIICAHNHPSGSSSPSEEDVTVTLRLFEAGKILGIEMLDHLVIGDPGFTSIKALGYF